MHVYIRELVAVHDAKFANTMRIIYGGNLNSDNALSILAMLDIGGDLIGRASLGPETFKHICQKLVNITNQ